MNCRRIVVGLAIAALLLPAGIVSARQNILLNGSMEFGPGPGGIDPQVPAEWTLFGVNVERSATVNLEPPAGGWALKAFGEPNSTSAGASQVVDVSAGQEVSASVWVYTPAFDQLAGTGEAGIVLEFLDFFGGTIALYDDYALNSASPADTWIPAMVGPFTAPSGTYEVRVSCRLKWTPPDIFGAAYWDDAQLIIDGGANALLNGDFEQAGVSAGQSSLGINEWTGFGDQEKSDAAALHGDYSLQLGVREAYNGLWQNMATLNPNDHIQLKAWVMHSATDPLLDSSRAGIKLEFDPTADVPPPEENLAFTTADPTDTWTFIDLATTVPAEATIARIVVIYGGAAAETGAIYFEDVHAGATSDPADNLLINPSFESGAGVPDDWTDFGDATKDCLNVFRTGVCSARTQGTTWAGLFQEVSVTPGQDLYVSAWAQTPSFNPIVDPLTVAGIKIEWAAGGVPPDVDIGEQDNEIDHTAPTDTWIPLTIDFQMGPDESALARFTNLTAKGTAQTGYAYFDACEAVVLNRYDGSDVDGDNDEDLRDFVWLQRTFNGSGAGMLPFNGLTFDHDDDTDVDFDDFEYFATWMTGPS